MLSMISIPVTALAVGLPAQRAIAQRFSALARHFISLRCNDLYAIGANSRHRPTQRAEGLGSR